MIKSNRSTVYQKSLASFILFALEKAVDGYIRFEDFTYHNYRYLYGTPELKKAALAKALKRLREKGLVQEIKLKDDLLIKLTEQGKELISENKEEKWDGKWRIVIFDIPEQKRLVRNLFRRNLKKWGFKQLQKSVWVSKKNVFDKLKTYIEELGLKPYVLVAESERTTFDIS